MRRQPSVQGVHRQPTYAGLLPEVRMIIDDLKVDWNCAASWIIAQAVCEHVGIRLDPALRYNSAARRQAQQRRRAR